VYAFCNPDILTLKTNIKRKSFQMVPEVRLCVTKPESDLIDLKDS